MRCAIPITDGIVASHFGHCEEFALFDVDEQNKRILGQKTIHSPGHQPGLLPAWLAREGVSLVIAGGMGSRAENLFQQNHIAVMTGILESDPEKAVLSYLEGNAAIGPNICDH